MRHSLKLVSFKISSANHNNNLCNVLNVSISVAPLREACGDYVYIDMQFMDWDHVNRFWNQQLHVQEFPSDARLRSRMEQCYSVISSMLTVNVTYLLMFQNMFLTANSPRNGLKMFKFVHLKTLILHLELK